MYFLYNRNVELFFNAGFEFKHLKPKMLSINAKNDIELKPKSLLKLNPSAGIAPTTNVTKRPFWGFLNHAWNEYDVKRVEEVGPNRACAEWLLKCGAQVKLTNWGSYIVDFNKMPGGSYERFKIEEIRAENACLMARGMEYFNGLKDLKTVKFVNCELIDDAAIAKLSYVRDSLSELQLVFCPLVTDVGISYLYLLPNLKELYINYMPNVKDPKLALKLLKEKLPNTKVEFIEDRIVQSDNQEEKKKD
jgi:H+-transporting ATP synthase F0 complex subunit s